MENFIKEWGAPILFAVVIYTALKPKQTGAGSGANTGAGSGAGASILPSYTYDCSNISCVDIMSLGTKRDEVVFLKQFINYVRSKLLEQFSQLPQVLQNDIEQLNSSSPYLNTASDNFDQDTENQVFVLTGETSGSLFSIVQKTYQRLSYYLGTSNAFSQEISTILFQMQQTLFN